MSRAPVLVEARPIPGGVELVFQVGDQRPSVLARGRSIDFPHIASCAGESLGDQRRDEAVRAAARCEVARAEAAAIWTAARGRR